MTTFELEVGPRVANSYRYQVTAEALIEVSSDRFDVWWTMSSDRQPTSNLAGALLMAVELEDLPRRGLS